ncbi:unnamed protein product [Calicophoron daubneyi]|uniref:Uncharacterized protein n=1 Tax=Calicophoron daubneyi TaxID=300641 RepID=A0AAV2TXB4_CALDB
MSTEGVCAYGPTVTELESLTHAEVVKRRRLRLLQVRVQANRNSKKMREAYEKRRACLARTVACALKEEFVWHARTELDVKLKQLQKALEECGKGQNKALNWRDPIPEMKRKKADAQRKADHRHELAMRVLSEQIHSHEEKEHEAKDRLQYVRGVERERAALIASLPPPEAPDYRESTKSPTPQPVVLVYDAATKNPVHAQMRPSNVTVTNMKETTTDNEGVQADQGQFLDAVTAAEMEERKMQNASRMDSLRAHEDLLKADLRGQNAIKRERVHRHYEALLTQLGEIDRKNIALRRRGMESGPAPGGLKDERVVNERLERAFEAEVLRQLAELQPKDGDPVIANSMERAMDVARILGFDNDAAEREEMQATKTVPDERTLVAGSKDASVMVSLDQDTTERRLESKVAVSQASESVQVNSQLIAQSSSDTTACISEVLGKDETVVDEKPVDDLSAEHAPTSDLTPSQNEVSESTLGPGERPELPPVSRRRISSSSRSAGSGSTQLPWTYTTTLIDLNHSDSSNSSQPRYRVWSVSGSEASERETSHQSDSASVQSELLRQQQALDEELAAIDRRIARLRLGSIRDASETPSSSLGGITEQGGKQSERQHTSTCATQPKPLTPREQYVVEGHATQDSAVRNLREESLNKLSPISSRSSSRVDSAYSNLREATPSVECNSSKRGNDPHLRGPLTAQILDKLSAIVRSQVESERQFSSSSSNLVSSRPSSSVSSSSRARSRKLTGTHTAPETNGLIITAMVTGPPSSYQDESSQPSRVRPSSRTSLTSSSFAPSSSSSSTEELQTTVSNGPSREQTNQSGIQSNSKESGDSHVVVPSVQLPISPPPSGRRVTSAEPRSSAFADKVSGDSLLGSSENNMAAAQKTLLTANITLVNRLADELARVAFNEACDEIRSEEQQRKESEHVTSATFSSTHSDRNVGSTTLMPTSSVSLPSALRASSRSPNSPSSVSSAQRISMLGQGDTLSRVLSSSSSSDSLKAQLKTLLTNSLINSLVSQTNNGSSSCVNDTNTSNLLRSLLSSLSLRSGDMNRGVDRSDLPARPHKENTHTSKFTLTKSVCTSPSSPSAAEAGHQDSNPLQTRDCKTSSSVVSPSTVECTSPSSASTISADNQPTVTNKIGITVQALKERVLSNYVKVDKDWLLSLAGQKQQTPSDSPATINSSTTDSSGAENLFQPLSPVEIPYEDVGSVSGTNSSRTQNSQTPIGSGDTRHIESVHFTASTSRRCMSPSHPAWHSGTVSFKPLPPLDEAVSEESLTNATIFESEKGTSSTDTYYTTPLSWSDGRKGSDFASLSVGSTSNSNLEPVSKFEVGPASSFSFSAVSPSNPTEESTLHRLRKNIPSTPVEPAEHEVVPIVGSDPSSSLHGQYEDSDGYVTSSSPQKDCGSDSAPVLDHYTRATTTTIDSSIVWDDADPHRPNTKGSTGEIMQTTEPQMEKSGTDATLTSERLGISDPNGECLVVPEIKEPRPSSPAEGAVDVSHPNQIGKSAGSLSMPTIFIDGLAEFDDDKDTTHPYRFTEPLYASWSNFLHNTISSGFGWSVSDSLQSFEQHEASCRSPTLSKLEVPPTAAHTAIAPSPLSKVGTVSKSGVKRTQTRPAGVRNPPIRNENGIPRNPWESMRRTVKPKVFQPSVGDRSGSRHTSRVGRSAKAGLARANLTRNSRSRPYSLGSRSRQGKGEGGTGSLSVTRTKQRQPRIHSISATKVVRNPPPAKRQSVLPVHKFRSAEKIPYGTPLCSGHSASLSVVPENQSIMPKSQALAQVIDNLVPGSSKRIYSSGVHADLRLFRKHPTEEARHLRNPMSFGSLATSTSSVSVEQTLRDRLARWRYARLTRPRYIFPTAAPSGPEGVAALNPLASDTASPSTSTSSHPVPPNQISTSAAVHRTSSPQQNSSPTLGQYALDDGSTTTSFWINEVGIPAVLEHRPSSPTPGETGLPAVSSDEGSAAAGSQSASVPSAFPFSAFDLDVPPAACAGDELTSGKVNSVRFASSPVSHSLSSESPNRELRQAQAGEISTMPISSIAEAIRMGIESATVSSSSQPMTHSSRIISSNKLSNAHIAAVNYPSTITIQQQREEMARVNRLRMKEFDKLRRQRLLRRKKRMT